MTVKKLPVIFLLFLSGKVCTAQQNEISLLNDRFSFVFPDSAKNIARATDIMSADPNMNNETRVIYDIGEKRIVFFARELYLTAAENMERKLTAESSQAYPLTVKTIVNKDSVRCIRSTPSVFDSTQSAILINTLTIKNADNLVSRLSVYINPAAYRDKITFDRITEQVFSSFKKGRRRVNLASRKETISLLETKTTMELTVPPNYIVTTDKKYDFEVYKIRKVLPYGGTGYSELVIYFGFYPSFFNKQLQLENNGQPDTDGTFMLQKVNWLNFKDEQRNLFLREQMFADDDIEENAKIHIAMLSDNLQQIEELSGIVKNILLKYDK